MPTSSENQKPEGQGTCGPQPDEPTPGRLNEMAAGGMASLLMTQPVRWAGVVAGQGSEDRDQGAPVFPLLQSVRPCGSWIPEHGILSMRSSWPVRRDNRRRARRSR